MSRSFSITLICLLINVQILAQPKASFYATPSKGCAPASVKFLDQSSGTSLSYYWDLGNGNTSTLKNPAAIYYNPGLYSVKLIITDNEGLKDSISKSSYIEVFKNPIAFFDAQNTSGCTPFDPVLIDKSIRGTGMINQWTWDYGDGKVATGQNPSHAYSSENIFSVSLIVKDVNGCQSDTLRKQFIKTKLTPIPLFSSDKNQGCGAPFKVNFIDKSTLLKSGDVYEWDFGDGTKSNSQNPAKTYSDSGLFNVSLKITATNGCSATSLVKNFISIRKPKPSFKYYPDKICEKTEVTFTNTSTPSNFSFVCNWDFGNGKTGSGYKPKTIYNTKGDYDVKLTIMLADGSCKETITLPKAVTITAKPQTKFTISDTLFCLPGHLDTFIDKTSGVVSRQWFIDDNPISTNTGIILNIKKPGKTQILLVTYNGVCYDSLMQFVYKDSLSPSIVTDPRKGCKPLKVTFKDKTVSKLPITSRLWDLGDGNYQTLDSFEYTYTKPGTYYITLTVTTENGCLFSTHDTVEVSEKPKVSFSFPYTEICNGSFLNVTTAKNLSASGIKNWKWFLDSSLIDTSKILKQKIRKKPDTYNLKLVAGTNGCNDTFVIKDILRVLPPLVSYTVSTLSCTGFPYTFTNTSDSADEIGWVCKDTIIMNKNVLVVNKNDPWPLKLFGKNFKSGCVDTFSALIPAAAMRELSFSYKGNLCSPAALTFTNTSQGYENFSWDWGNGVDEQTDIITHFKTLQTGSYTIKLKGSTPDGCKDSSTQTLRVVGPTMSAKVTPTEGCGPLEIKLISKFSDSSLKNKKWLISGLPPVNVSADTMTYTLSQPGPLAGGAYAVSLSAQDPSGCVSASSDTIKVFGLKFYFEILSLATCAYPKLTIYARSNDSDFKAKALSYFWDLGDGRKLTGPYVDFIYKNAGSYKLNLKIIDKNGCVSERDTFIVNTFKSISANLVADKLDANCPPLRVNFVSKSDAKFGKIIKYEWDFGDGSTSQLMNPSHVYLKAGKFSITLKVTDDLGCTDEVKYKDLILINGPVGTYFFDKKQGCTPLTVNFLSTVANTKKLEWDMGDGVVLEDSIKCAYLYTRVGKYIPLLILTDSFGCKYSLPPIDTIEVLPYPEPHFNFTTPCLGKPVSFINNSKALMGIITQSLWDFGDGDTSMLKNPEHIFKNKGKYLVKLKVWNSGGCTAELVKELIIKNTFADFISEDSFYCAGQLPKLVNTSHSDTSFKHFQWFINDVLMSAISTPSIGKLAAGAYKVSLAVMDDYGCADTITKPQGIKVGDTLPPEPPFIYRVSVVSDFEVLAQFSANRSFDFKKYTLYFDGKKTDVFNLADTSFVRNGLNTLNQVYCFKMSTTNLCGLESDLSTVPEHCTVEVKARGELRKVLVKWNAYTGWPVAKYEVYREDLGQKGKYDYLSTVSGATLQLFDSLVFCKVQHFYKIKAFELGGHHMVSWSDTSAAKPLFENAVPENLTLRATVDMDKEISIEWTGSGNPRIPIVEYVLEKSEDGVHYKWYQSFSPEVLSYTDKKVLVDEQSYFYRTYAIDTCELRSPMNSFAKSILLKADTTPQERPFVAWSTYQGWKEGVNQYEVQRKNADGTFVTIGVCSNLDTMMIDQVTDLNGYPFYCYRVIAYKNTESGQKQIVSISNEDYAPVRSRIFAANAFTMNGDNLNETFDVKGLYIRNYNIKIFTRWGEKIFESDDMNIDWDGYYNGKQCQMDAYIWVIKAIGVDDVNWPMMGTVTLIR